MVCLTLQDRISRLGLALNVYRADIKDALVILFNSDLGMFRAENLRKVRRQGADMMVNYCVTEHCEIYTSAAFNHAENRTTHERIRGNGTAVQS